MGSEGSHCDGSVSIKRPHDVFVSYSRKDSRQVLGWVERFRAEGVTVFLDQSGIEAATNFAEVLAQTIEQCKVFVIFISSESASSRWVNNEMSYALERGKPVLPLFLEDVKLSGAIALQLATVHHVALFRGSAPVNLEAILTTLKRYGVLEEKGRQGAPVSTKRLSTRMLVAIAAALLLVAAVIATAVLATGTPGEGEEFQVNVHSEHSQQAPAAAALPDGGFVIAWQSEFQDGSGEGVFARWYGPEGAPAEKEIQVNAFTADKQEWPRIVALPDSRIIVVWMSLFQDGDGWGVFAQLFNPDRSKHLSEFQVNAFSRSDQTMGVPAALGGDNFVVVWQSLGQDGDDWGVFGQVFGTNASREGPEFQVSYSTAGRQKYPFVSATAEGGFLVVWEALPPGSDGYDIIGRLFDASGMPLGNEFQVNSFARGWQRWPIALAVKDGGFVIVWTSYAQDGAGSGVFAQRFDAAGNKAGNEFQVNTFTGNNQWVPTAAPLEDGGFVVAWMSQEQDGMGHGSYGQLFNATGSRRGAEFQLNSTTAGDQQVRTIQSLADGRLLAVWESTGQDGAGWGIFARLFALTEVDSDR